MSDKETLAVYAAKADEYARLTDAAVDNDPQLNPHLRAFISALPAGAEVLDLGCGPGMAAAVMVRAGLRATAWDPVPEMVALAARHKGVTAELRGFEDIDGQDRWDGIWASFSLLHATRAEMPRHLAAIHRALRPGGLFHIGVKTGSGSKRDGIGRLYTYYTDDALTALLEEAGYTVTHRSTGTDSGLDGTMAPWIRIDAHA